MDCEVTGKGIGYYGGVVDYVSVKIKCSDFVVRFFAINSVYLFPKIFGACAVVDIIYEKVPSGFLLFYYFISIL